MWCWIGENPETTRNAILFVGGALGIFFAWWRCRTADRNLRHQQYLKGLELLDPEGVAHHGLSYINRIIGIVALAKLMEEDPKQYDDKVVRILERFLSNPPQFGEDIGEHRKGETYYESSDIGEAIKALNQRSKKRKQNNPPRLWPSNGPFVFEDGIVKPNTDHEHYKRWLEVKGVSPSSVLPPLTPTPHPRTNEP